MRVEEWRQPQRQLMLAVVLVARLSAGALGWLGWLLLQQDAAIERQRQADLLQQAADRTASAMRLALAGLPGRAAQDVAGSFQPCHDGVVRRASHQRRQHVGVEDDHRSKSTGRTG